ALQLRKAVPDGGSRIAFHPDGAAPWHAATGDINASRDVNHQQEVPNGFEAEDVLPHPARRESVRGRTGMGAEWYDHRSGHRCAIRSPGAERDRAGAG